MDSGSISLLAAVGFFMVMGSAFMGPQGIMIGGLGLVLIWVGCFGPNFLK